MADDVNAKVDRPCLNPQHKDKLAQNRGLCGTCYAMALGLVRSGKVTWQTLVQKGRALESAKGPSKRSVSRDWLLGE